MSDRLRTTKDVPFRQTGSGFNPQWRCMGCHQNRSHIGSLGRGVFKRCAVCLAKTPAARSAG